MTKGVAYSPNLGQQPMVQSQSLCQASALALAMGSNQTQSLGLYMVLWCEPEPWPFQSPWALGLGTWFLGFGP